MRFCLRNYSGVAINTLGRPSSPLCGDGRQLILSNFTGDSSRLCHNWNTRFPLGLLAILLAMFDAQAGRTSAGK
jgi:hypothetical protein